MELSENGLPFGAIATRAGLHGARGERNVLRDDDGALGGALGDPVVGRVHAGGDDDALDQRIARNRDRAVADDIDLQAVPFGDAIDFLLHRAGVGVDVDRDGCRPTASRAVPQKRTARALSPRMSPSIRLKALS